MSIWFSMAGLVLGFFGALFLSIDAFKTKKQIVSQSSFGKIPVLGEGERMTSAAMSSAREQEARRQGLFSNLTKAKAGVILLSAAFLLQIIGKLLIL